MVFPVNNYRIYAPQIQGGDVAAPDPNVRGMAGWSDTLQNVVSSGVSILTSRFGTPSGFYQQSTDPATGQVTTTYRQPEGNNANVFASTGFTATPQGSTSSLLLLGGVGLLAVLLLKNR